MKIVSRYTRLFGCMFLAIGTLYPQSGTQTFKSAFKGKFYVGVSINRQQSMGYDKKEQQLITQYYNSISPENDLKWENIHPSEDTYKFGPADAYVEFGKREGMFIIGHTLVWHSQTPDWVFKDSKGNLLTREALLSRMKAHIETVVGRYKGVIKGWDVVNEALNEDGSLRNSKWRSIIGDDYIEKAFEYAHAADPAAQLYYNDYNLNHYEKRQGAIRIIQQLKSKGLPIKAVGEQAHYSLWHGTDKEVEALLQDFIKIGITVNFTELDISVLPDKGASSTADVSNAAVYEESLNPFTKNLPKDVEQQLANHYGNIFKMFVKYSEHIDRVTFWGLTDKNTWLNNWPIRGRTNYPLPFNRDLSLKEDVVKKIIEANNE